jgi:DnaJ-class molecular chaperone
LLVEFELKLYQALFGFDKMLTHLDGRKLHLHHTGKTDFGTMRRISGEGMKDLRSGVKGDLVIKFNVNLPDITNDTLIKALTLIDKTESQNEKNMLKETDLVKTMMLDMKSFKDQVRETDSDEDEHHQQHQQQAQCAQQ